MEYRHRIYYSAAQRAGIFSYLLEDCLSRNDGKAAKCDAWAKIAAR
jgi:hypothetical protein